MRKLGESPIPVGLKLEDFDPAEPDADEPFRSLVGHLMWLLPKPDLVIFLRFVLLRYSHKVIHWRARIWMAHFSQYIIFASILGITCLRGAAVDINLKVFIPISHRRLRTGRL